MSILELSKVPMYGFHYDYIWKKYDNKSRLILKDTGSLIYETETKTKNVYDHFSTLRYYFAKSKYYDDSNILVVFKMKDEMSGNDIGEIVRLKPKMYSLLVNIKKQKKSMKMLLLK